MNKFGKSIWLVFASLFLVACGNQQPLPPVSYDGLLLVEDTKSDVVYAREGLSLEGYTKIMLHEADIAFKKNWQRDQNINRAGSYRINDDDMAQIIANGKIIFAEVFIEELMEAGYAVVDTPGADVLEIRPAIIDLDITAPQVDTPGRVTTYASNAGEATLYIELFDSVSGDILVRATDRRKDRDESIGWAMHSSSIENRQVYTRGLRYWSGLLIKALDEANGR